MPKLRKVEKSPNAGYYNDILLCSVPLLAMSYYYYGLRPVIAMGIALLTAYILDCLFTPLHGEGYHVHENSSECFAALIVLMMPASVPYRIVVTAVAVAVIAKEAFGGEGHYPFHPAAVGICVAGVSWPEAIFRYPEPGTQLPLWNTDGVVLSAGMNATLKDGGLPTASTMNLLTGNVAAPIGTASALVIAACALYLLVQKRLELRVVLPYFAATILLAWLFPQLNALPTFSFPWQYVQERIYLEKYILLSGTTLFGGVFLASEPVTCPNREGSCLLYGAVLGALCIAFRFYSSYETGACFALLMAGAIPEWLDYLGRRVEIMRYLREGEERRGKQRERKPKQA